MHMMIEENFGRNGINKPESMTNLYQMTYGFLVKVQIWLKSSEYEIVEERLRNHDRTE